MPAFCCGTPVPPCERASAGAGIALGLLGRNIEKHSHSCRVLGVLREYVSAPCRRVCHPRLSLLAATPRGNLRVVWSPAASMVLLRPQATRIQATSALAPSCDRYCVCGRRRVFRGRLYELSSTNDPRRSRRTTARCSCYVGVVRSAAGLGRQPTPADSDTNQPRWARRRGHSG